MNEIWKPIKGYENYMVSSLGNVKSLNYNRTGKEQILKKTQKPNGYLAVSLHKDNKQITKMVHRLVAETFLPNPNNYPQVHHVDENKHNNCIINLRWVTAKENYHYSEDKQKEVHEKQKLTNSRRKILKCLDLKTNEITYYPSYSEAGKQIKARSGSIWLSVKKSKQPYRNRYIFEETN